MAEPTVERAPAQGRPSRSFAAIRQARRVLLRVPPALAVALAVLVVLVGQLAEDLADSAPLQLMDPASSVRRWTVVVAVLYMLGISRALDRYIRSSLRALDAAVRLDPQRLRRYEVRMRRPDVLVDAVLLLLSAMVVLLMFSAAGVSLPIDDPITGAPRHLPTDAFGSALVLVEYTIVGWAVLSLVFCTVSRARALGSLSREPLEVNVFDTANLLPLGNIALATALAPAGIVVILLFGFGRPSAPTSWTLLLLVTVASLVALILPLRGIHRQMERAKGDVLGAINGQLRDAYEQVRRAAMEDITETTRLNHRVTTLVNLRKTVGEMTTWPFQDTLAFTRAVLIAGAPLVYTVINELIKIFWIAPLGR